MNFVFVHLTVFVCLSVGLFFSVCHLFVGLSVSWYGPWIVCQSVGWSIGLSFGWSVVQVVDLSFGWFVIQHVDPSVGLSFGRYIMVICVVDLSASLLVYWLICP